MAVRGGAESLPIIDKVNQVFDPFLVDFAASKNGSIAGEHGIGLQRVNQLR